MGWPGWAGNVLIVTGLWLVGRRRWEAFAFTAVGEVIWVGVAVARHQWDLAFICLVFAILAVRNLFLWRQAAPPLVVATDAELLAEMSRRGWTAGILDAIERAGERTPGTEPKGQP